MRVRSAGSASTSRATVAGSMLRAPRQAGGLSARLVGRSPLELDRVPHGCVEFADALLLLLLLAFEIETRSIEDQHHARRGVLHIRGQRVCRARGTLAI